MQKIDVICNFDKCTGCSACVNVCPTGAISMRECVAGFLYPKIDKDKCANCMECVKTCSVNNGVKPCKTNVGYSAFVTDKDALKKSSSGGVFGALANAVFNENGVVYGAVYDDKLKVVHVKATNQTELDNIQGSKYVQSDKRETFKEIKTLLDKGESVLFSGCPCEVGGLKAYLKCDYNNLFTLDLVCHGVPSYKVFRAYVNGKPYGDKVVNVAFRDKRNGWENSTVRYDLSDGTEEIESYFDCKFLKGYIDNVYLRKSCYNCVFKGDARASDITLGDLWGAKESGFVNVNESGTSLVIVHTEKGAKFIDRLVKGGVLNISNISVSDAYKHNPSAVESMPLTNKRAKFYNVFGVNNFDEALKASYKSSFFEKVKYKLQNIFGKK